MTGISNEARSSEADAFAALLNAGSVEIRSGTIPGSPNDTATGTLLGTFTLPNPAFGSASNGVITLNSVANTTVTTAGTATWARWKKSGGATEMDTTVGTSGSDLIIDDDVLLLSETLKLTSFVYTVPE